MLNQELVNAAMARDSIDQAIARARRERAAEVARLLGLAVASVRAAFSRGIQRASAALRATTISRNTRHA